MLTRLRRLLRDSRKPDLYELLDALDKCYENLEEVEDALKGYNYFVEDRLRSYLMGCVQELSACLAGMSDYEVTQTVVKDLVTRKGVEQITELVDDNKPMPQMGELGELEDHPF